MKNWQDLMVEHLTLKGRAPRTIESYTGVTRTFLNYFKKKKAVEYDCRRYFLHLINKRNIY